MLKNFLRKRDVEPAPQVRRVGICATHVQDDQLVPATHLKLVPEHAMTQGAEHPRDATALNEEHLSSEPGQVGEPSDRGALTEAEERFIASLERDAWRGVLGGVVAPPNVPYCVVVDMGYNTVRILRTIQQSSAGSYITLLNELESKHYTIEREAVGSVHAIKQVYEMHGRKNRSALLGMSEAEETRNARLFDDLVAGAYKLGASDVHFELDKDQRSHVKLRVRGRMYTWKSFDYAVLFNALSAGYNSRTKHGTNSSGSFSIERGMSTMTRLKTDGVMVEARFSSLPTVDGGDAVLRLIVNDPKSEANIWPLEKLGYAPSHCAEITTALAKNQGLIAIAGSTGSGKSKTLQTMMDSLPYKDQLKRVAVEDPSEYAMPGVRRVSIQRGPDDPEEVVRQKFLGTLRQEMRMDPDVVMIGEIRDRESGEIASEFVVTGHRALTTIHGDGCVDVIARAAGQLIRIPEEILAMRKFIAATMYQRLLPTVCPHCKLPAARVLDSSLLAVIRNKYGLNPEAMVCANEEGCSYCRLPGVIAGGGTAGLTVCAEILSPNREIRERIAVRDWNGVERLWRTQRIADFDDPDMTGKTAFEHALYKAATGQIDVRDIEREFEPLSVYEIYPKKGEVA